MNRRFLCNASTLRMGGGLQVAAAFIVNTLDSSSGVTWFYAVSERLAKELNELGVDTQRPEIAVFRSSPARSIVARKKLVALAKQVEADAVYTVFGPAYVRFSQPHLCGVADGYVTHADSLAYGCLPGPSARLRMALTCHYKAYWLRFADAWVVEAEVARLGLSRRLGCPTSAVSVVPNTCAPNYLGVNDGRRLIGCPGRLRVLCFAAYYPHKNLESVPFVVEALRDLRTLPPLEFVLTLPDSPQLKAIMAVARRLGVADAINNVGPVALVDGPALYRSCDLLFHPSLLETFSAAYPEAMAMGIPIVASDRHFARAICSDAALYFPPLDAKAAAAAIAKVLNSPGLRDRLVRAGRRRLREFGRPEEKQERLLDVIRGFGQRLGWS